MSQWGLILRARKKGDDFCGAEGHHKKDPSIKVAIICVFKGAGKNECRDKADKAEQKIKNLGNFKIKHRFQLNRYYTAADWATINNQLWEGCKNVGDFTRKKWNKCVKPGADKGGYIELRGSCI